MGKFITVLVILLAAAGAAWFIAGRAEGPAVEIVKPLKGIGQAGELVVHVEAPGGELSQLDVELEQGERRTRLFSLADARGALLTRQGDNGVRLTQPIGKRSIPELESGTARLIVTAARPVLFGVRQAQTSATRELAVRLAPPGIAVMSLHHYLNHGGSEMVVYRVSPADAASGVRVGDHEYPGYPAAGAGIEGADPGLRVAFFALLWDQDPDRTPIRVFARDDVDNESSASFDYRVFPKTFRKSRIELDDRFLMRVVPAILANTPELQVKDPADLLGSYLSINRELRRINNAKITALARETAPRILWQGPFRQLTNSAVEAGFADQRAYVYAGAEVDHQVHLGYDLASLSGAPVQAANRGRVLFAGWLGIYGNCVILDHGMGLQTLYAHLSSMDVKPGDSVEMNAALGRTGATGLAGGDHLHFTTLLAGNAVTPVDWWSSQWVQDRILRKLAEAGAR